MLAVCGSVWLSSIFVVSSAATSSSVTSTPYEVGVWFFTAWNRSSHSIHVRATERVYGRTGDAWGGVRDYAQGRGVVPILDPKNNRPVDFANREPALGFYDLMNPETVKAEMAEASKAGITFFSMYWYFDVASGEELDISAPTSLFLNGNGSKVKTALALIGEGHGKIGLDTWKRVIVPRLVRYMSSEAYYRVDGRPLVIDFQLPFMPGGDYVAAYAELRKQAYAALHVDPLIIRVLSSTATSGDEAYFARAANPDGFTCFSYPIRRGGEPYAEYIRDWLPAMVKQFGIRDGGYALSRMFIPCGSVGQDPRPWYKIGRESAGGPNDMAFTVGTTPALFRDHVLALRGFLDSHEKLTKKMVILYAWNEWGEAAASIEPSRVDGQVYGDVVRDVFGRKSSAH